LSRESSEVEVWRSLSARAFILALVFEIPLLFLSVIINNYTDKNMTYGAFVIPMFYVVLAAAALGKFSNKLRLTSREYMVIFTAMSMMVGSYYFSKGIAGEEGMHQFDWLVGMEGQVFGDADWLWGRPGSWNDLTPWFIFPTGNTRSLLGDILLNGMRPGMAFDMSPLAVPILFWSALVLLYSFIGLFVVFGLVGKPWVEEERLFFPLAVPHMYLFKTADEIDPNTNQSRLLNLKDPTIKVFWGSIVIGLLLSMGPLISEVYPPAAIVLPTAWWGETTVRMDALAATLPGAYSTGLLFYDMSILWLLAPNDILYTSIFVYIVFGVIWQSVAVGMRIIPYTPGIEFLNPWDDVPAWWEPFPFGSIGSVGVGLGIALWLVWTLRHRIKQLISALKGEDIVEHGLSLKSVTWFGIASMVAWVVLLTAAGSPFLMNLGMVVILILYAILVARIWAMFYWHTQQFTDNSFALEVPYYVGSQLGYWNPMENFGSWDNPNPSAAWYVYNRTQWAVGTWTMMFHTLTSGSLVNLYKIAHYNRLNLKHVMILIIMCSTVFVVLGQVMTYWILGHAGGYANTNAWEWTLWAPEGAYWSGSDWGPTRYSFQNDLIYMIGGALVAIALYLIRLRFAWFFISPEALYANLFLPNYCWLAAAIALIVKTTGIRTVGIRRFEEYIMPAAAGTVIGFGAPWFLAMLVNFANVALPRFMSLFVP